MLARFASAQPPALASRERSPICANVSDDRGAFLRRRNARRAGNASSAHARMPLLIDTAKTRAL
jgi:hypothetical protein